MSATIARASIRQLTSRRGLALANGHSRFFSVSPPKHGVVKDISHITPVEVYPLLVLVGGACTVGLTMGVRSLFTDPTLRVHANQPLDYKEQPDRLVTA